MRKLVLAFAALMSFTAAASAAEPAKGVDYDHLVLSLSWSPTFCATKSGQKDKDQCGAKKFGFVVHGLWAQFARGQKRDCPDATGEVPAKTVEQTLPVMPSRKLIGHEWEKHGTCFGPDPAAYFAKTKAAFDKVKIPSAFKSPDKPREMTADEIRKAFVDANSGMPVDGLAVSCKKPRGKDGAQAELGEVRICLDKDLKFRACARTVRDRCEGKAKLAAAK
jgi:ribonuclease T2